MSSIGQVIEALEGPLLRAQLDQLPSDAVAPELEKIVDRCSPLHDLDFATVRGNLLSGTPIHNADPSNPFRFVVFKNDIFFIEILIWFTDPTLIHSHPFSGLAYVLDGQSVDVRFDFAKEGELGDINWGKLTPAGIEKIGRGSKFYFSTELDKDFIHRVFHLSPHCSTLRIGLRRGLGLRPQWSFLYPGLALDSAFFLRKDEDLRLRLVERHFSFSLADFRDGMRSLLQADLPASVIWFLCRFQANHPNYDVYGELIADCPRFSDSLKQTLSDALARCIGDSFLCGDRFASPEALLLTGFTELFGFGKETGDYVSQVAEGKSVRGWLLKALTDLALSHHLGAPVAWHLLDRMKQFENTGQSVPASVRPLGLKAPLSTFYEETWQLSRFETFLGAHVY